MERLAALTPRPRVNLILYHGVLAPRAAWRSLVLKPRAGLTHATLGLVLGQLGRLDEGIAEATRARALEPVSALVGFRGASTFWFARRYDEALEESKRVISLDPGFPQGFWVQAAVLSNLGRHGEAVEAAERAVMLSSRQSFFLGVSATTYAAAGRRDEATRILDELSERGRHEYISPLYFADTATALGEFDTAFAWLERACEERVPLLGIVYLTHG